MNNSKPYFIDLASLTNGTLRVLRRISVGPSRDIYFTDAGYNIGMVTVGTYEGQPSKILGVLYLRADALDRLVQGGALALADYEAAGAKPNDGGFKND